MAEGFRLSKKLAVRVVPNSTIIGEAPFFSLAGLFPKNKTRQSFLSSMA